ncbi:MAG TPA: branched-chain amino acid ABC transporter permease [Devosiaceae bacterium]
MTIGLLRRHISAAALLVIVLGVSPFVVGRPFWTDLTVMIGIFSLFALSAGIAYGQAGIPSIATGTFAAIGAYGTAIVTTELNWSPFVGLAIALIAPALVAYPLARLVTRLSPLPLSLATFALSGAAEIGIRAGGSITGAYVGIVGIPPVPGASSAEAMYFLTWLLIVVAVFVSTNLIHSSYGRAVNTARHDALRATADGANVARLLAGFLSFSASIAGLGGWLYAHYITYLSPESLNTNLAISALLMAVVGGPQTVIGPIIGAVLLLVLNNFLPAAQTQGMVYGAVLVGALILAPKGFMGVVETFVTARHRRTRGVTGHAGAETAS